MNLVTSGSNKATLALHISNLERLELSLALQSHIENIEKHIKNYGKYGDERFSREYWELSLASAQESMAKLEALGV